MAVHFFAVFSKTKGSFSNIDGDDNESVKKAIGLITKATTLHVHYTFWFSFFPAVTARLGREISCLDVL